MKIDSIHNYKNGWVVGDFSPTLLKTNQWEMSIQRFDLGHVSDNHYHKLTTEYNIIVEGGVAFAGDKKIYGRGTIFVIEPNETVDLEYVLDTTLVVFRDGSFPGDKWI